MLSMSDSSQSPAISDQSQAISEMPLGMQLLAGGAVGFTLENIPAHERLPVFREVFGRAVLKYDLEPLPDVPFDIDLKFQALPGLMMMSGRAHGSRNRRTRETLAADRTDDIGIVVNLTGAHLGTHAGPTLGLAAGAATLRS